MIELDYKIDSELLNKTALHYAQEIGKDVKNTQIRKFYDQILDLNQKAKLTEDFEGEILPFVKMLNSKVAYASTRKSGGANLINRAFVEMMSMCINQVNTKEKLAVFKLFFEAIIGFHKSIEGKK
ncbi:MAG: type III-A CRISPR-associated protein Csm2 [Sulfurospirillum sp.]|nr:type III-A CRISPR-associated protein Csm2 [Sulfurospirillum sp.]